MPRFQVGVPLYAAAWIDDSTFVVAGGGGEGKHGVKNKVVVVNADSGPVSEYTFAAGEDTPMSIAVDGKQQVITGVNYARSEIKEGHNDHLRVLVAGSDGLLEEKSRADWFKSTDPEAYQRITVAEKDVVAISSSEEPATVVVTTRTQQNELRIEEGVSALALSSDADKLAIISPKLIQIMEVSSLRELARIPAPVSSHPAKQLVWVKAAWVGTSELVVGATLGNRKSSSLHAFEKTSTNGWKQVHSKQIGSGSITALSAHSSLIGAALSSGDIAIFLPRLKLVRRLQGHHRFPITALAMRGQYVVTTGLDGTVKVETIKGSVGSTLVWVLASSVVIVLLSIFALVVLRHDLEDLLYIDFTDFASYLPVGKQPTESAHSLPPGVVEVDLTMGSAPAAEIFPHIPGHEHTIVRHHFKTVSTQEATDTIDSTLSATLQPDEKPSAEGSLVAEWDPAPEPEADLTIEEGIEPTESENDISNAASDVTSSDGNTVAAQEVPFSEVDETEPIETDLIDRAVEAAEPEVAEIEFEAVSEANSPTVDEVEATAFSDSDNWVDGTPTVVVMETITELVATATVTVLDQPPPNKGKDLSHSTCGGENLASLTVTLPDPVASPISTDADPHYLVSAPTDIETNWEEAGAVEHSAYIRQRTVIDVDAETGIHTDDRPSEDVGATDAANDQAVHSATDDANDQAVDSVILDSFNIDNANAEHENVSDVEKTSEDTLSSRPDDEMHESTRSEL